MRVTALMVGQGPPSYGMTFVNRRGENFGMGGSRVLRGTDAAGRFDGESISYAWVASG
jgi:hypothetical protein